jgi:hypothetical protein
MSIISKVAQFKVLLGDSDLILEDATMKIIMDCLEKSGLTKQPTPLTTTTAKATAPTVGTKKLTAYNFFFKTKYAELKAEGVESGLRMTAVGDAWKLVKADDAEHNKWKAMAEGAEPVPAIFKPSTTTGPKKLTAYNFFFKTKYAELKAEGVESGLRMTAVGDAWKLVKADDAEHNKWKAMAEAQ